MIGDKESAFTTVPMNVGPKRRGVIDRDRRTASKSIGVTTIGDFKMMWVTTGVVADDAAATVYLTYDGEATGTAVFTSTNRPTLSVEYDANASAGGFIRGQGAEEPSSAYRARNRGDLWYDVHWVANPGVLAVTVTNKSGADADFIVTASGV